MPLRIREYKDSPIIATYRSLRDEDLHVEALLSELEAPSARLLEATALFLVEWARVTEPELPFDKAHPDALRRIGFIAERIGQYTHLDKPVRDRLSRMADTVFQRVATPFEDIGFSSTTSKPRMQRLQRRADDTARRWKVWGEVELREEFLA